VLSLGSSSIPCVVSWFFFFALCCLLALLLCFVLSFGSRIKYDLDQTHLVGFATDGAASTVGVHEDFATKLKREILHLFRTHCIAHREALASKDAMEAISPMALLEKLSNKLHGWIGKSFLRNEALQSLLTLMEIERLKVLHVHNVQWLSMGQVMERMASIMPVILSVFGSPRNYGQ